MIFNRVWAENFAYNLIEDAGRICYNSEKSTHNFTRNEFIKKLVKRKHDSVLEHVAVSIEFITDRGILMEHRTHRVGSTFHAQSTRYCNYGKSSVKFIKPVDVDIPLGACNLVIVNDEPVFTFDSGEMIKEGPEFKFLMGLNNAEKIYTGLVNDDGWSPQKARGVLPNALMTKYLATHNLREWKHIFKLRTAKDAHPQIQALLNPVREIFEEVMPEIFLKD